MIANRDVDLYWQMVERAKATDRLTQMHNRSAAQLQAIDMARTLISDKCPDPIWEIGYGGGRTYDRLCRLFPENPITVFDNRPDGQEIVESMGHVFHYGNAFTTLPEAAAKLSGPVCFIHADIGTTSFESDLNRFAGLADALQPIVTPGTLIACDRPISASNWELIMSGLEHRWPYFLWRI